MVSVDNGATFDIALDNLSSAQGLTGALSSSNGKFNDYISNTTTKQRDIPISLIDSVGINTTLPVAVTYYLMRGRDVDCGSVTYRFWTVTGSPDTTGSQYVGSKCGSSPLTDIVIVKKYNL